MNEAFSEADNITQTHCWTHTLNKYGTFPSQYMIGKTWLFDSVFTATPSQSSDLKSVRQDVRWSMSSLPFACCLDLSETPAFWCQSPDDPRGSLLSPRDAGTHRLMSEDEMMMMMTMMKGCGERQVGKREKIGLKRWNTRSSWLTATVTIFFPILSHNRYSRLMVPLFWWNIVLQKLKLIRVSTQAQKEEEPKVRLSDMSDGK